MVNKSWKKKVLVAVLAMAVVMQQSGMTVVSYANVDNDERTLEEALDLTDEKDTADGEDSTEEENSTEDDSTEEDSTEEEIADEDDVLGDIDTEFQEPKISKTVLSIKAGKTGELEILGDYDDVEWSSSKSSVAKVDDTGYVTAVKAGKAIITATVSYTLPSESEWVDVDEDESTEVENAEEEITDDIGDESDFEKENVVIKKFTCEVTVTQDKQKVVSKPKINMTKVTLKVKKSKTLKITGTKSKVTWKSSNSKIVKVSKGKITAIKAGKAIITAKVDGKTLKCTVTVKKK